ncbi:phage tail protein [Nissabacter sp. SGAir0207]|uniref:phage tail protein n=1 Tax=Nissabacter sp. SGAir0207 TaxID=2126321 RepID=UPI0010CCD277|nr:phage tail protein [Nissabacter sp. SGAir0207]QCR38752.1 phage tail protein [Nissabacter sp. SGAir0207]
MPSPDFDRKENGRYATHGLSAAEFLKVFNRIRKTQRKNRQGARRTLTPAMMRNKELEKFLELGKKKEGTFFTPEDMKRFITGRMAHRTQFNSDVPGITYAQLVAQSTKIDVQRASNKVDDGSGIKKAIFIRLQHNTAMVKVEASDISMDDHHLVRVRFEEWDRYVEDVGDEKASLMTLSRQLAAGRVSFDCDCGRHQYWYRYMATAGNYALKPPAEYAFPKVRNPDLTGVACKHVIHTMTRFQSMTWQRQLGQQLKKAATQVAFGDDKKKTTRTFTEDEQKAMGRNRSAETDQDKVRKEFARYQAAQQAMAKKQATSRDQIEQLRKKAARARTATAKKAAELKLALARAKKAEQERDDAKKLVAEQLRMRKQGFKDAMKLTGMTDKQAENAFNKWLSEQIGKTN